jgi:regulatory protein
MVSDGYLSDQRYAALYAEDRRAIDGWGNERIITNLREAGIPAEIIEAVVGSRGHTDQVGDAIRVLDQRIGAKPQDERERERALGMLARRGYSLEIAYDAVRAFERQ